MSGVGQVILEWLVLDTLTREYYFLQTSAFCSGFSCTKFASLLLKAMLRGIVFAFFSRNRDCLHIYMSAYSSTHSSK